MTPLRVVVVDDSAPMREGISSALRSIGGCLVVGEAGDGLEGVDLVRSLRPDLVVMDLHMPGMGGLEAMRLLKSELPSTEVILVTSMLEPETRKEALASGATACLEKGSKMWDGLRAVVKGIKVNAQGLIALDGGQCCP